MFLAVDGTLPWSRDELGILSAVYGAVLTQNSIETEFQSYGTASIKFHTPPAFFLDLYFFVVAFNMVFFDNQFLVLQSSTRSLNKLQCIFTESAHWGESVYMLQYPCVESCAIKCILFKSLIIPIYKGQQSK